MLDAVSHDLVGHLAASIEEVSLGEQHAGLVAFPFKSMHVGVGNQEFLQVELVYANTVKLCEASHQSFFLRGVAGHFHGYLF